MITKSSGDVFADLGFEPEMAHNLKIRSSMMMELKSIIKDLGLSQTQAAEKLGVGQPRISDLMRGKIEQFTIDTLVGMLDKFDVDTDFTLSARSLAISESVQEPKINSTQAFIKSWSTLTQLQDILDAQITGTASEILKTIELEAFMENISFVPNPFQASGLPHGLVTWVGNNVLGNALEGLVWQYKSTFVAGVGEPTKPTKALRQILTNDTRSNAQSLDVCDRLAA